MDAQEGGELCFKNKYSNKTTQDLYWFGLPDLRPVLNHPGREFHYNSGFKTGSPETLQPQVLRAHLQPYNKFYTGSLVTYLTVSPSHHARV